MPSRHVFPGPRTARRAGALALAVILCPLAPALADTKGEALPEGARSRVEVGGGVVVVLDGDGASDPSVQADLESLLPDLRDLAPAAKGSAGEEIVVRYRGKGRVGPGGQAYPDNDPLSREDWTPADEDPAQSSFVAFNLATKNEFEVRMPRTLVHRLDAAAQASGLNRGMNFDRGAAPASAAVPPGPGAWSGGVDNRARFYGINAPVTHWERQRVSDFGGCSVTLIGPRHVITAAHCVYNPNNADPWTDNVSIRVGRNGTSWMDSVFIDNDNIPGGQVLWYWVPQGYLNTQDEQYDISVIVTPKRIGETTGGWMGWWYLTGATMNTQSLWNVGYPGCVTFTSNGTPRIDEPNPCSENHLYGDVNTCYPAQFENVDGDGWNRNFRHRCDASAGQSGSPIYVNYNGQGWGVTGVHIQSLCGTTAGNPCSQADSVRPLRASRVTPEWSGWISYFRNLYP